MKMLTIPQVSINPIEQPKKFDYVFTPVFENLLHNLEEFNPYEPLNMHKNKTLLQREKLIEDYQGIVEQVYLYTIEHIIPEIIEQELSSFLFSYYNEMIKEEIMLTMHKVFIEVFRNEIAAYFSGKQLMYFNSHTGILSERFLNYYKEYLLKKYDACWDVIYNNVSGYDYENDKFIVAAGDTYRILESILNQN